MKKIIASLMTVILALAFTPSQLKAEATPTTITATNPAEAAKATVLLNRLHEIDAMDKASLTSSEKRALRKEVRGIKSELNELDGRVYLSVGAIIIIILLLILLL